MPTETDDNLGSYSIVGLGTKHDRDSFSCGEEPLDLYFRRQASQDARRSFASIFVAEEKASGVVHGYYTISATAVPLDLVPEQQKKKWPRYQMVPAVRLGRLAVATAAQGRGLGGLLLLDAIHRSLCTEIAWAAFVVDAKSQRACEFYRHYNFQVLLDDPHHLVLFRETAEKLFE